jgi:hypothetical protein
MPVEETGTVKVASKALNRDDAIAAIEKLGGTVKHDSKASGNPVTVIRLQEAQVNDAALVNLGPRAEVQQLYLDRSAVTDAGLIHLKSLTNLTHLGLYSCSRIDGSGFEHFQGLKSLRAITLHGTRTTDAALVHLRQLSSLESLSLTDCAITDEGLGHLKGMPYLIALDLSHTRVTDTGLVYLNTMPSLREVKLHGLPVTDAGVAQLSDLPRLKLIGLKGTKVTDARIEDLKKALPALKIHR